MRLMLVYVLSKQNVCLYLSSYLILIETQYSIALVDGREIGDKVLDIQNGLRLLTLGKMSSICYNTRHLPILIPLQTIGK
jgi:hypothetical protein